MIQAYKSHLMRRCFSFLSEMQLRVRKHTAGRDHDLETERDTTGDGKWILDFNEAYNPWCAYSE